MSLLNGKLVPLINLVRVLVLSAREVGPAANSEESLGSAEREVGPAAIPCCARSGSDDPTRHGSHPKTKPGKYGIISLFDGVSSVVRLLTKKLGCPPMAILLAENDETVRRLVCAEFGYRTDEKWGYTVSGSACLYISDVHKLAENDCLLLRQLTALFPGLKWFIVGGSPCQDLTYAGYLHGLLGLVGARSRLFFLLLLTIRTIQILVGSSSVRFLVENAGSMKDIHFVAFCKLLGLPFAEPFDQYTWDLAKFTCFITRKRKFFRNMADVEPITDLDSWHSEDSGPLLTISGKTVAFAPFTSHKKDNELWDLSLILDIVSAACFSLGLLLLGWQGGLSALLQYSDWASTCSPMGTHCPPTIS